MRGPLGSAFGGLERREEMKQITHRMTGKVLATVDSSDLRGADLEGMDLRGASLSGMDLRSWKRPLWQVMVVHVALIAGVLLAWATTGRDVRVLLWVGVLQPLLSLALFLTERTTKLGGADLSAADARETLLSGVDLHDANLAEADLRGARADGARLADASLRGGRSTRGRSIECARVWRRPEGG